MATTISYSNFSTAVKARCFPFGTPENLDTQADQIIVEALVYIQRAVECFQARHVDVLNSEAGSYTSCGITFIARPAGKILRIRNRLKDSDTEDSDDAETEAEEDDHCDIFTYDRVDRDELEKIGDELKDVDLSNCRLKWGNYSISKSNIAITPPLKDDEQIELEWSGVKREYLDDDLLSGDPELFSAVCDYVSMEFARLYDKDMETFRTSKESFDFKVRDLYLECREHGITLPDYKEGSQVPGIEFAFVADGGYTNSNAVAVGVLVNNRNPDLLILGGDNNYPSGATDTIQENFAKWGSYVNRGQVLACMGNHDWQTESGAPQLAFLQLPGNGRYYTYRRGPVEFFCLNSNSTEPDGYISTSDQAVWLEAALAASEAIWKVVFFHHPPYTSSTNYSPGITQMRWPFASWGAHVALSGHSHHYERLEVGGFPYIVAGTGGSPLYTFTTPALTESVKRVSDFGALFGYADGSKLILKFIDIDGVLQDILAIT